MAGQIIKRGEDTWLVRIFNGRDEKGKRCYLNQTIKGKKKDAETYLSKTLTAISTDTFIEPSRMTVKAYLEKWLKTALRSHVRPNTYREYAALLERYVEPSLGAKRLADVQPFDVQNLYNEMQERGLSSRTVRYTHAVLSSALKQAVRWRMLRRNPCEGVELPRMVSREMRALTPEESARFLEVASQDRWGVFFLLALTTGLRPSESLGLRWANVDLSRGVLSVQRSLIWRSYHDGDWYFSEPKTPRSRRQIPLPASLWRALIEHKRKQAEERLKAGPDYQNLDLVFATHIGKPLMPHNIIRQHFKPLLEKAKLPASIRLYDLRHSCATLLLAANEHPKVVGERLGHASVTLTLDT